MAAFRYRSMATLLLLSTLLLSTSAQISIDTKNMPTDHELLHEMSEAQRSSVDPLRSMTKDMPDGFNIGKDQRAERAEEAMHLRANPMPDGLSDVQKLAEKQTSIPKRAGSTLLQDEPMPDGLALKKPEQYVSGDDTMLASSGTDPMSINVQ